MSLMPNLSENDPQTYAIIGAAMSVHREFGSGFVESAYQEALAIEFELENIPFEREVPICVTYKGRELSCGFRADFICYDSIIVELKATKAIDEIHFAQVLNYLKATRFERGLLINFGENSLRWERIVRSR